MEEKKVEDVSKPEETKQEVETKSDKPADSEEKKEDKNSDESKDTNPPPPPPQEIVLKVYMHCEGCAKKVRRCLKGFEGVDYVFTDCKNHKVVVKGEKADPVKVFERIQKKSHRKVELLSPVPAPPPPEELKMEEEKETPNPDEKKEEAITVVLKVNMHCEACAQEIKRRILRMKGVENVESDLVNSQVSVKGIFDPEKLLHHVHRRTGKQVVIVKNEPAEKKEEEKAKEEKKAEEGGGEEEKKGGDDAVTEKKDGGEEVPAGGENGGDAVKVVEMKKNEFYYYNPQIHQIYPQGQRYPSEGFVYQNYPSHPSQMFSDENPNACSVM